ncbi:MAG TPA: hypothetical protein VFC78_23050 [Tepidisphaeraceae bacterium]|nr:hypothetical protein [Tepidisphaeraceae bacterium]
MPTPNNVPRIVQKVRASLAALPGQSLRVSGERLDDRWLYIAVEPTQAGVSALDHANAMSRIERDLRKTGDDEVLLVAAIEE